MFFKLNSLSAFIFYFNRSKLETRLLEFVNLSVSPKLFYSSATVLVLIFFKLNSLSALIFYFYSSKLETRLLEFDNFSTPPKMFYSSATVLVLMRFQIKQSLCFYFLS